VRGLGVPARYGGVGLDPATAAQTFSIIATATTQASASYVPMPTRRRAAGRDQQVRRPARQNLGTGIAAYEDTAAWVQQRVQGRRILIKHQAVALRVAAVATNPEAVSALLRRQP
jgi:Acyl-CoA dehydrogenase, C-terminal domain